MDTTTAAHANNLFPTAQGNAPDLAEEQTAKSSLSTGFPVAPMLKPSSLAAEIAALGASTEVRTGTKSEQALAYLMTCPNETAKREDLAAFIGVKPTDIVAYLKPAITNGRITRDGNLFSVGVEPEVRAVKQPTAAPAKKQKPAPAPPAPPAPKAPAAEVAAVEAKPEYLPIATLSVSGFSMAVWADGATTIRAAGSAVSLSRSQMGVLQMFLELTESSGPNNG